MGAGVSIWDRIRIASAQRLWTGLADRAESLDPEARERLGQAARLLRRQAGRLLDPAPQCQPGSGPALGVAGADWIWRPDLWRGGLAFSSEDRLAGIAGAKSGLQICEGVVLFHDCPLEEITCRQRPGAGDGPDAEARSSAALELEVFGFRGSFMSLAFDLPPAAVEGARRKHVIRLDGRIGAERPLSVLARLNVRHGPNVERIEGQITGGHIAGGQIPGGQIPAAASAVVAEFDLAYGRIDEARIEKIWVDLFLHGPQMNRISLRDLTLCRHPRAAL